MGKLTMSFTEAGQKLYRVANIELDWSIDDECVLDPRGSGALIICLAKDKKIVTYAPGIWASFVIQEN